MAATMAIFGVPTVDNLRNFLLTTTTEVLSFFQNCEKHPNLPVTPSPGRGDSAGMFEF